MKKIVSLLENASPKVKLNSLLVLVIIAIVWFIAPLIPIDGAHPFSGKGARIVLLLILLGAYGLRSLFSLYQEHQAKTWSVIKSRTTQVLQLISEYFHRACQRSKQNMQGFKKRLNEDKKRRRLRKLPWYFVLGAPGSGKKTVIHNTGLYFAKPEHFGEEASQYLNQFPDFEWWFSEQAVLVDGMTYNKESDMKSWKSFLRLLKKERHRKPLNGVLLVFSLSELMLYTNQQRQEFIQDICQYIRDLHSTFKSLVPVYIIFNKADLVEGFMEFFSDLGKEELRQIWGMTWPLEECSDLSQVQSFFQNEYTNLIDHLRNRMMWSLESERSVRGRELINAFPQQMQLLRKPLETFINELFGATRYTQALQLRGLYFTSCDQQFGEPNDFVRQAMSKKFQLVPPTFERQPRLGECYFMRHLFLDVIYPEASVLGESERSKKIRKIAYRSGMAACPLALIIGWGSLYSGYTDNVQAIGNVNDQLAIYDSAYHNLPASDGNVIETLPLLDALNHSDERYHQESTWSMNLLYASHLIGSDINDTRDRALQTLFLPRVAATLESSLKGNIEDPNILYATFKGYLAFSASSVVKPSAVKPPMELKWESDLADNHANITKLRYYLATALEHSPEKLPLDDQLIDRLRIECEQIVPAERAYGLLELNSHVSQLPKLVISSDVGTSFYKVFTTTDKTKVNIPALYTKAGFEKIFVDQYKAIADEVARDNRDIGLVTPENTIQTAGQIATFMQITYGKRYTSTWNDALASIEVKPFENLNDAISDYELLTSDQSPLLKLSNIIYDNTATISYKNVHVTQDYKGIQTYTNHPSKDDPSWNATLKALKGVHDYLVSIEQSKDKNKTSFEEASNTLSGKDSPIKALTDIAMKSPEPLKRWLLSLSKNTWAIVLDGADRYINNAWQTQVMTAYNSKIKNRYPLTTHASAEISIDSFNQFFSEKGTLDTFFKTYIKPFVNTNEQHWALYEVNGFTAEIPIKTIKLFERASRIQKEYFPNGSNEASVSFSMKPIRLDSDASSVMLVIGSDRLTYSHGPQNMTTLKWPFQTSDMQSRYLINDFRGGQYGQSSSGPWSVFKLFDYGSLAPSNSSGTYILYLKNHGLRATYQINGTADINVFKLTDLKGFYLPEKVTG